MTCLFFEACLSDFSVIYCVLEFMLSAASLLRFMRTLSRKGCDWNGYVVGQIRSQIESFFFT